MSRFGSRPDTERREQVAQLRAKGLKLREIGEQLGCSFQAVHELLTHQGARFVPVRCQECGAEITRVRVAMDRSVWCLTCLAKHPDATFGQRLKAHRLAKGLTIRGLAKRSGVSPVPIIYYESDQREPPWSTLDKLIRALGMGFGVRQRAKRKLRSAGLAIRCTKCRKVIVKMWMNSNNNGPVYCVGCLPRGATFAQRLKSQRIASGMTLMALGKVCGVAWQTLGSHEQGRTEPNSRTLAKMTRALGVEWLGEK